MTHRLVLVIAALLAGHAVAQAPSTPRAIDADLIVALLGTGLEDADGQRFASSQRALCLTESEGPIGRRPVPSPLQSLPAPRELPLDTWLALEAVRFTSDSAAGDDLSGAIVFYLHLSTDASRPPEAPAFTTVQELVREQIGRGTN